MAAAPELLFVMSGIGTKAKFVVVRGKVRYEDRAAIVSLKCRPQGGTHCCSPPPLDCTVLRRRERRLNV
jgi:hypothetical protein